MSSTIAKPQLRGRHVSQIKMNLIGMTVFSLSMAMAFKFLYADPKKRKFQEFYKTYDPQKRLKIMCDAGLLESCENNKA